MPDKPKNELKMCLRQKRHIAASDGILRPGGKHDQDSFYLPRQHMLKVSEKREMEMAYSA